uniref:Uncharacterized protein n=1 Tax=Schistosoma mansoni TaxID=6183 RepID=A0A5K4F6Q3_SCHMA
MKFDYSEKSCHQLIPYNMKVVQEISQIIRWKYYDIAELNIELFKHKFLSEVLKVIIDNEK